MKTCTKCKESKPLSEFQKHIHSPDGLRYDCRACHLRTAQEWYKKNRQAHLDRQKTPAAKVKRRDYFLKKKYGITPEQYAEMLAGQRSRCSICLRHQREFDKFLAVDHNHKTGEVRELICFDCNRGIGWFRDDPNAMKRAVQYIKRHT